MSEFNFVGDLPRQNAGGRSSDPLLAEFAEALRANAGQWAQWPRPLSEKSVSARASVINGHGQACPVTMRDTGFEAATRKGVLYVRFVGGQS